MRALVCLAILPLLLLTACSGDSTPARDESALASAPVAQASPDTSVPADNPAPPRADDAGNFPTDVLLAYVRARNRADWKTAYSLTGPPKANYRFLSRTWANDRVPFDDFVMHETRIVQPDKALVRVTYSTIGFSSLEGVPPEETRRVVVVREPGEWWVLEKQDGRWEVTFRDPLD